MKERGSQMEVGKRTGARKFQVARLPRDMTCHMNNRRRVRSVREATLATPSSKDPGKLMYVNSMQVISKEKERKVVGKQNNTVQ